MSIASPAVDCDMSLNVGAMRGRGLLPSAGRYSGEFLLASASIASDFLGMVESVVVVSVGAASRAFGVVASGGEGVLIA